MATNLGLPINRLVNVNYTLSPPAPQVENIDTMLVIGTSNVIDTVQRMRTYSSIGAVATDFGTSAPEYLAAVLWFEQNPGPAQLNIGRWANTNLPALLVGASLPGLNYTSFTGITSGAFTIQMDGIYQSVSGLNFSGVTNLNGVASTIATAMSTFANGVTWNAVNQNFTITDLYPSTIISPSPSIGFAIAPTACGYLRFGGQPANNDTITLNGTTITFVTGAPTGSQVQIATTLPLTMAALETFLINSVDTQLVKFKYGPVVNTTAGVYVISLLAATAGTGGNALTLAKSSTNITVSGATLAGGSGTDVSSLIGLTSTNSGAYSVPYTMAETALQSVVVLDNQYSGLWYGLTVLGVADSDVLAISAYIEANTITQHFYGVTTQEAGVLVSTNTSNIAYQLQQLKYNHTAVQYSSSNPYAVASLLARILTTNWQANNSTITLMYKQEPGIVPENLSVAQINALESFNCNVFVNYSNATAIIEKGTCASGQFIDTIIGLDWLVIQLQANWYAALYQSPTKIPQTDPGMHILATIAEQTCANAVNNGLLAPGVWNSGGFGQINQGDFLSKGYYVYQPSVSSQSQSQRQSRISVPFQIAVKLAGAVQTIDGSILVNS